MVGCSALGCSNNNAKGFRMFRFPMDPGRRSIWATNVNRPGWLPTSASRLCEAHFDGNQFEFNRLDGWKKLKPFAVPTFFDDPSLFEVKVGRPKKKKDPELLVTGSPMINFDSTTGKGDTGYILMVEDVSEDKRIKLNKRGYQTELELLPEFKDWLTGVQGSPLAAYCTICCKLLNGRRLSLLKHKSTKRHQINEAKLSIKSENDEDGISTADSHYDVTEFLEIDEEDEKSVMAELSTHVLDTSRGLPASSVGVSLYEYSNKNWVLLHEGNTNIDGRYDKFTDNTILEPNRYKLHFAVEEYFNRFQQDTIFPFVEVVFEIKEKTKKLHVPLLLSPYGYSTYRGS